MVDMPKRKPARTPEEIEEWLNSPEYKELVAVNGEARQMIYDLAYESPRLKVLLDDHEEFNQQLLTYVLMPDLSYEMVTMLKEGGTDAELVPVLFDIISDYWARYEDEGPSSVRNLIKSEFIDVIIDYPDLNLEALLSKPLQESCQEALHYYRKGVSRASKITTLGKRIKRKLQGPKEYGK
jgi:hypothetical protein